MKNLLFGGLTILILLLISNSAAGQFWESNFNTDDEGWQVYLWPQDDFDDPVYNQGGYICYSNGDQINWLFTKLDWLDWRTLYGGTISFDIKVSGEGDYLNPGGTVMLDLPGESGTYFYAGIPIKPPKDVWATIEVPILDEVFTNYGNPDIKVSDQLELIRGVDIRGNLLEGLETTCIDNVKVFPPNIQPVPNIMANGSDGPVFLSTSQPLSLKVSLDAGFYEGQMADWWVAADTPFGIFSYIFPIGWQENLNFTIQTPLFNLVTPFEVLNSPLPAGAYTFYFAIDENADGLPDGSFLDFVAVTVADE